jgi:hypothetical protein
MGRRLQADTIHLRNNHMFDDKEPQDIFAGTDKAPATPAQQPPSAVVRASVAPAPRPQAAMAPAPVMAAPRPSMDSAPTSHLMRNLVIIVLAIAAVAGGAYLAYALMIKPIMDAGVAPVLPATTTPETPAEETPTTPAEETPAATPDELNPTFLDSDGDGLSNAAELEAGTSSTNPDTDGDGLGDREEVRVYGTDPNRTDTDGDGFLDGAEVQGGYNPNGPGKLLQIPSNP